MIQRKRGDTTASEQLVRRFADHFWKTDWPGSSRPSVFYDPRALDPEGPGGVLHAKAVVADDEAFITSANLTEAALDRNIELGVLIRDRAVALAVGGYFRSLIDRDLLKPLPLEHDRNAITILQTSLVPALMGDSNQFESLIAVSRLRLLPGSAI